MRTRNVLVAGQGMAQQDRVGAPGINPRSAWIGLAGAAFFTFSDSLLALGMFAGQRPLGPQTVMITYWIGQLGITLSAYWQMAGRPYVASLSPTTGKHGKTETSYYGD